VVWRSQRGLWLRCEGRGRQAGRQAERVACGGGRFERVRLKQRNVHGCFFLLSPRHPTPPSTYRPPRPPPLSSLRFHTCGRLRRRYRTAHPPPATGAAPLLPPCPSWRGLVPTDGSGSSYVSPCLEVLGALGAGGDGVCPLQQRPSDHCSEHLLIQGECYPCLLRDRPSRSYPRLIVRTRKASTCIPWPLGQGALKV